MVHARVPGNTPGVGVDPMLLGSFTPGTGQHNLDCDLVAGTATTVCWQLYFYLVELLFLLLFFQAVVSHNVRLSNLNSVQFSWTAPSIAGEVDF